MGANARHLVSDHLHGCLPPGVPASFSKIVNASVKTAGRKKVIEADLVMFDGQPARVEVFKAGQVFGIPIWGHRWTSLPGGHASYEEGRWIRINPETLEPFPAQMSLALEPCEASDD